MRSRSILVLAAVLLLGAACGDDTSNGAQQPAEKTEVTGPQTFEVDIDGDTAEFNGVFYAYFPNQLAAHPGDTVKLDRKSVV